MFAARQAEPRGPAFVVRVREFPPDGLGCACCDRFLHDPGARGEALLRDLPQHDESLGPEYETEPIGDPAAQALADVAHAPNAYDRAIICSAGSERSAGLRLVTRFFTSTGVGSTSPGAGSWNTHGQWRPSGEPWRARSPASRSAGETAQLARVRLVAVRGGR